MATETKTVPRNMRMLGERVTFATDTAEGDRATKTRRFSMIAYSGQPVETFFGPMIVDLAGMDTHDSMPILREHVRDHVAGFSDGVENNGKTLAVDGAVSAATETGKEVAALSDEGFPWQASMGFAIRRVEELEAGDSKKVNGLEFMGPGMVVTKSTLLESSFVALGADPNTSGVVLSAWAVAANQENSDHVAVESFTRKEASRMPDNEKKDPAVVVAEFASQHGDQVEQWKQEGRKAGMIEGGKVERQRFLELHKAFAERPGFVCEQFDKGNDVTEANGDLVKLMQTEKEEADKDRTEMAEKLKGFEDGHDGVEFKSGDEGSGGEPSVAQVCEKNWAKNFESCNDEFPSKAVYRSYLDDLKRDGEKITG